MKPRAAAHFGHLVKPGATVKLSAIDADEKGPFSGKDDPKAEKQLAADLVRLCQLQERLFGEAQRSILVVLQAMDTGGKDGVLRKVAGPLDSRGVQVISFKAPNTEEAAHDYLWRIHKKAPAKGNLTFFNRSHYEEVLVVRVLDLKPKDVWKRRFDHINAFERQLTDEGTRIVKIYLHISKDEQKLRLQERLDDPDKHWKFDKGDLPMREKWDDFMTAYEEAMHKTSTADAPWWVVPANRKWYRDLCVARILVNVLEEMAPKYPVSELDAKKIVIPD